MKPGHDSELDRLERLFREHPGRQFTAAEIARATGAKKRSLSTYW